jgi:hypothetical protein
MPQNNIYPWEFTTQTELSDEELEYLRELRRKKADRCDVHKAYVRPFSFLTLLRCTSTERIDKIVSYLNLIILVTSLFHYYLS